MFCVVAIGGDLSAVLLARRRFRAPGSVGPLGHFLRAGADGRARSAAVPAAAARDAGSAKQAIRSARELAERSANEARGRGGEFEQKTAAARAEIYRQMDEMRKAALDERAEMLARHARRGRGGVAAASAQLQAEAEEARRRLAADAEALGAAVAERILGRKAS